MRRRILLIASCLLPAACAPSQTNTPDFEIVENKAPAAPATSEPDPPAPPGSAEVDRELPPLTPPAPSDVVWEGTLAKTSTVAFGGSPYCKYSVTFSDVAVRLTLDAIGNVKTSKVTGKMTEAAIDCSNKPIAPHVHSYTYDAAGRLDPKLDLVLRGGAANEPNAEVIFTAAAGDAPDKPVKLRFHRTDQKAPLEWTVPAALTLHRVAAP